MKNESRIQVYQAMCRDRMEMIMNSISIINQYIFNIFLITLFSILYVNNFQKWKNENCYQVCFDVTPTAKNTTASFHMPQSEKPKPEIIESTNRPARPKKVVRGTSKTMAKIREQNPSPEFGLPFWQLLTLCSRKNNTFYQTQKMYNKMFHCLRHQFFHKTVAIVLSIVVVIL